MTNSWSFGCAQFLGTEASCVLHVTLKIDSVVEVAMAVIVSTTPMRKEPNLPERMEKISNVLYKHFN